MEKKEKALKNKDINVIVDVLVQLQALNYVESIAKPEWIEEVLAMFKQNAESSGLNGLQEVNKVGVLLQTHAIGK